MERQLTSRFCGLMGVFLQNPPHASIDYRHQPRLPLRQVARHPARSRRSRTRIWLRERTGLLARPCGTSLKQQHLFDCLNRFCVTFFSLQFASSRGRVHSFCFLFVSLLRSFFEIVAAIVLLFILVCRMRRPRIVLFMARIEIPDKLGFCLCSVFSLAS